VSDCFGTNFVLYPAKHQMQKIPGGNVMKTLSLAIISAAIVLASCSSTKQTAFSEYDDVYYNPNNTERQAVVTPQEAVSMQPVYQEPAYTEPVVLVDENLSDYEKYRLQQESEMLGESYTPEGSEALYAEQYIEYDTLGQFGQEGAPVVVNNYNYYTNPNDYYYSSNLRRFSDEYYGWNYYDPYYTDMYWYTRSPFSWGISMGWGYPGWGMRFSYGYPYRSYYGMGYGGYYDPWNSWGYGGYYGGYYGGSYWSGYNHGFYNGYYTGRYGSDYYGSANYRYGRLDNRHSYGYSRTSNVIAGRSKASTAGDPRYRSRTTASTKAATATRNNTGVANTTQRQVRSNSATATQRQVRSNSANGVQRQVRTNTNNAAQRTNNGAIKTTRSTQPANVQQRRSSNATNRRGTYTPSYSKPRTSSSASYNKSATQNRSYTQSGTQNRTPTVNRSATPSRSNASYSRPSSSNRSSKSYSRPSSSSGSRSSGSVSRSSGSSSRSSGSVSRSSGGSSSRSSGGSSSRSSGSSSRR